jgi:hypothetical protein
MISESDLSRFKDKCLMLNEWCDTMDLVLTKDVHIMTEITGDIENRSNDSSQL